MTAPATRKEGTMMLLHAVLLAWLVLYAGTKLFYLFTDA
jgi:hypothetical protein